MANGVYGVFNIKEAYIQKHITDSPNSTTGPTCGPLLRADCIKKVSVTNKETLVKQPGNGSQSCRVDSIKEDAEVQMLTGGRNDEFNAAIFGAAFFTKPGEANYVDSAQSTSNYVKVLARTDRIGKNGADLWLIIYKVLFTGDSVNAEVSKHSDFDMKGSAIYCQSYIEVVRNGSLVPENPGWHLIEHDEAELILPPSPGGVTPDVASHVPTTAATAVARASSVVITMNKAVREATVNPYTAWVALTASPDTPLPATVTLDATRLIITIDPVSTLAASTSHTWKLTTAITDDNDVPIAAATDTFTTGT